MVLKSWQASRNAVMITSIMALDRIKRLKNDVLQDWTKEAVRFSLALQSPDPYHCASVRCPLDTALLLPPLHPHRVLREPMDTLAAAAAAAAPAADAAPAAVDAPPLPSPFARLTTEQRWTCVVLHKQGWKKKRIAAEVGCHVNSVRAVIMASHLRRALRQSQWTAALH